MASNPSIKLDFTIPYRGGLKNWSMRFHFAGGVPVDHAHWAALSSAIWTSLRPGIRNDCYQETVVGYADDTSPSVYNEPPNHSAGSFSAGTGVEQTAYVAALLSWNTDARNSRGGPIFCRNFVHGVNTETADREAVAATQKTALQAFAHAFSDAGGGFSDGTVAHKRSAPQGAVGLEGVCRPFVSHRVLARRG